MSAALKPPATMTVAEFLVWEPGDHRRWQLVDGEPVAMAPPSDNHSALQSELAYLLTAHLIAAGSPCRVGTGPGVILRTLKAENWRIPDLGVTCAPVTDTHEMPDPVLLVEILSPGNYRQSRANAWTYMTLPSVREVLVVHGTRIEAELLSRQPDGSWPAEPVRVHDGGTLALGGVGLTLPLRAIYRTTSLAA